VLASEPEPEDPVEPEPEPPEDDSPPESATPNLDAARAIIAELPALPEPRPEPLERPTFPKPDWAEEAKPAGRRRRQKRRRGSQKGTQ
jgi:hypothetical protein